MRNTFIDELIRQAKHNDRIFLVVGDLGYSVIEPFVDAFPDRFLNAGVAEQNMMSVSAGLAKEGYHVFTYSIGNFSTLRCLEQIRNDVCYHKLPVCVVAVGGGYMYGSLGASHHLTEDIGIMRTLPHMQVLVPFSKRNTSDVVSAVLVSNEPTYIRLGRVVSEPDCPSGDGLACIKRQEGGAETAIIISGQVPEDLSSFADNELADIYALWKIKPLPKTALRELFDLYTHIVVVEDHQQSSGVYSALSEMNSSFTSFSVADAFSSWVGKEVEIRNKMIVRQK